MKNHKSLIFILLIPAFILLIPLVAMQVTEEVDWHAGDFVVGWLLMVGVGLGFRLAVTRVAGSGNGAYKLAVGLALGTGFVLLWMNLAVGLIGSEENPANLLYGGVLAVGIVGALNVRFQADGMARVLFATALTQMMVPVVALLIWQPPFNPGTIGVFAVNTVFAGLFVGSAMLFRRSSRQPQLNRSTV